MNCITGTVSANMFSPGSPAFGSFPNGASRTDNAIAIAQRGVMMRIWGRPVLDDFQGPGSWFAGAGAVFPFTQEKIPVWFASIPCVDVVREY